MINTEEERVANLLEEIEAAFDGVSRDGGVSLHEADVIDDYGSIHQRYKARKLDTESRWQDVPASDIEHFNWIFPFLDAKGGLYYLPAYMSWSLRNYRTSDSWSHSFLIYHLESHNRSDYSIEFELLNPAQKRAIAHFLQFAAEYQEEWDELNPFDEEVAQSALNSYWNQFA
jgi:hypothetical protein